MKTGSESSPLVVGDYYEGALGPSILLVLASREAVVWLAAVFDDLAKADLGTTLRLHDQPRVEIGAALTALELRRVGQAPDRHLVRTPDGRFIWSCTSGEWRTAGLMLGPFLEQSGHQYLTSETDDDAIIEVSYGEDHGLT